MKRKKQLNKNETYLELLPILLVIGLLPLVIRLKVLDVPTPYPWYDSDITTLGDLFCYYKSALLIACALMAIGIIGYKMLAERFKIARNKLIYLTYAYMATVMISWLLTTNDYVSMYGYIGHLENGFVLLAYILIFLYTALTVRTEQGFKRITIIWIASLIILFLIGLSQFIGHNIIYTDFFKTLIVPADYLSQNDEIFELKIPSTTIFQTLYHYNYVSFYASMTAPFFIALLLFDNHRKRRILYFIMVAITLFNLFGSTARNGFIGVFGSFLVILFFYRGHIFKQWKIFAASSITLVVLLILFTTMTDNLLLNRFAQLYQEIVTTSNYPLNEILTDQDVITIDHDRFSLTIKNESSETMPASFYDSSGQRLSIRKAADSTYVLSDSSGTPLPLYDNLKFEFGYYEKEPLLAVSIDGTGWPFGFSDGSYYFINTIGKFETLTDIPSIGFEGKERMGSARGYIWSRTLPLIQQYFFFGSGPDTYATVFPQNDYVGKFNAYDIQKIVVDKPHNILLDYAVNTGVPSLLFLLALWIGYIAWSFKLFYKSDFTSYSSLFGIACLAGVIGYLISGMFNDTNVNITPVFWIVLGLGFAANTAYQKELNS